MNLKRISIRAALTSIVALLLLSLAVPAQAVNSWVYNTGNRWIQIDDSCTSPESIGPDYSRVLSCSGRRVRMPAASGSGANGWCIRITQPVVGMRKVRCNYDARSYWIDFSWAPRTNIDRYRV